MYQELLPHPALRPFVDRFWTRTNSGQADTDVVRILPDGCIDIVVDCTHGGAATVVGPMTRALVFALSRPVRLVGVRFRPGGAVPFLRISAAALTDLECPCGDIGASALIPPGLDETKELARAVRQFEQALLSKVTDLAPPDAHVQFALQTIFARSLPAIDTLARNLGWSRQHLARTIRAHVGVGPKQLARTARVHRAVALLQRQPRTTIADVAAALGYFDQAHMAGEFRALVGTSPHSVRQAPGSIFPILSLFDSA